MIARQSIVVACQEVAPNSELHVKTQPPFNWAKGTRDDEPNDCYVRGYDELPTQTSCTINGKSLKFVIHLHCLIPPEWVIA